MDIRLLKKYRLLAVQKFCIIEESSLYPRCSFRWMRDKSELTPTYYLCEDGERIFNEKKRKYESTKDFEEAKQMLSDLVRRYIEYLMIRERVRRAGLKTVRKIYE